MESSPFHDRLEALFHEAVELAAEERSGFLVRVRAEDEALADSLAELLDAHPGAEGLIGRLGQAVPELDRREADPLELPEGTRIGPYTVLSAVGRGGMGVVYRAERVDGAFEQRVAIKLVKRGMDSDEILRRFRAERQILANLEHPNIARLYDGGVADDGRPYLAMEYVEGGRITDFADARRMTVPDRLDLFAEACEAVRFAHRNLVVHRDLKPANIMVTDDGTVKLLDFGIAKLLDAGSDEVTRADARILTPAYAAPEQLAGGVITTATDVYSLSVVLHELLTGRRPDRNPNHALASRSVESPGETVDEDGTTSIRTPAELSASRGTTPDGLRSALAGDLDAILLKALSPDADARYPSVDELLDDLKRHRMARPVSARLPTPWYRATRFVRRNWASVVGVSAVAASLAIGLGVALMQRNVARLERDASDAVTRYLEGMFESVNPVGRDPGADTLRVVDFLDRSTENALTDLRDQPAVQARMMRTLGRAHFSLGDFERARDLWHRGVEARRAAGLEPDPDLVGDLGEVAVARSDWIGADTLLASALSAARESGRDSARARILGIQARGLLVRDRFDDAETVLGQAIPLLGTIGNDSGLADALYMLAGLRAERGDPAGAIEPQQQGLAVFRALRGDDTQAAIGLSNLATFFMMSGRLDEAERAFAESLRIHDQRTPPGMGAQLAAMAQYANLLSRMDQPDRADSLYQVVAERADSVGDRRRLANVLANRSSLRRSVGDTEGSVELGRRAARTAEGLYGAGAPSTAPYLTMLAGALDAAGDSTEAETLYETAVIATGEGVDARAPQRISAERGAARGLSRRGRHAEAERALLELLDRTPAGAPSGSDVQRSRLGTLRELANAYERWGRVAEADSYRRLMEEEAPSGGHPGAGE